MVDFMILPVLRKSLQLRGACRQFFDRDIGEQDRVGRFLRMRADTEPDQDRTTKLVEQSAPVP